MGKRTRKGACHLCGEYGDLSFEHIPPKAAFNDRPIVQANIERLMREDSDLEGLDKIIGQTQQRGAGAYTLCGKCNNNTGAWYGSAYVDWAYQGLRLSEYAQKAPSLLFPVDIFPLRVIKQIICMFFSANGEGFRIGQIDLVKFVLNKEAKYVSPDLKIYAYFNASGRSRQSGIVGSVSISSRKETKVFSEISYPPWGFVMTLDNSMPPDKKLVDISAFASYSYNDWKTINLQIPVLPVYSWLPGDYRTRKQVIEQTRANIERRE